jgi:hypothetical protein
MGDLDDDELKATRKLNGSDTKIVLNKAMIEELIREKEGWLDTKTGDFDNDIYYLLKGEIRVLKALVKGDLSKI